MASFEDLPLEIVEHILTFVSPYNDLKNCRQVCKKWYEISVTVARRKRTNLKKSLVKGSLDLDSPRISSVEPVIRHRFAHSAAIADSFMYVFGGCSNTFTTYNDLWSFDLSTNKWCRLLTGGSYPSPKAYSSMVVWGKKLYLLGGWSHPAPYPIFQGVTLHDEFHTYDMATNEWKQIFSTHGPEACAGHGATIHRDRMVVFGGIHRHDPTKPSNFLHCYDFVSESWTIPNVEGPSPDHRYGHSQVAIDDNHLLIMGGFGQLKQSLRDIWLLDMTKPVWQWIPIEIQRMDNQPSDICFSPACIIDGSIVIVLSTSSTRTDFNINRILQRGASKAMGLMNQVRCIKSDEQLSKMPSVNVSQKPSIRPNASDNKGKRMMMLLKAELRMKALAQKSHERNADGNGCSSQITTFAIDIEDILKKHIAAFNKRHQKLIETDKSEYVPADSLHTLLMGRGHMIMFGGIIYHPNKGENSVSNCLFYIRPDIE